MEFTVTLHTPASSFCIGSLSFKNCASSNTSLAFFAEKRNVTLLPAPSSGETITGLRCASTEVASKTNAINNCIFFI